MLLWVGFHMPEGFIGHSLHCHLFGIQPVQWLTVELSLLHSCGEDNASDAAALLAISCGNLHLPAGLSLANSGEECSNIATTIHICLLDHHTNSGEDNVCNAVASLALNCKDLHLPAGPLSKQLEKKMCIT